VNEFNDDDDKEKNAEANFLKVALSNKIQFRSHIQKHEVPRLFLIAAHKITKI